MCADAGDAGAEAPTHCNDRAVYVNLVYSVATFAFMAASLPLGFLGDKLGPRRTAAACNLAAGVGALVIAIPRGWNAPVDTFFAGLPLAAFFGPGLQVAFATIANLFPGSESTVIGVMSGMMGGSAIVFPVYNAVHAAVPSASLSSLFAAHAAACCLFAAMCFLYPRSTVPEARGPQEVRVELAKPAATAGSGGDRAQLSTGEPGREEGKNALATLPSTPRDDSALSCDVEGAAESTASRSTASDTESISLLALACSRPVRALLLLYIVHYLRLAFYLGTASLQLLRLAQGDEPAAATYLALLGWIAPFGCLAAPAIGLVDDSKGHRFAMTVVHAAGVLHCVVSLVPSLPVQVAGMLLYTTQQEMLFAVGLARVLQLVPTQQFGVASGAFLLIGALVRSVHRSRPYPHRGARPHGPSTAANA